MAKVIIFGNSEIAEIAHFYLTHDSPHEVSGFTVDGSHLQSDTFHERPVVPFELLEQHYPPAEYKLFVPISYKKVNQIRASKYHAAKERGYSFISYISSKAAYYGTPVGENCFIFEHNVIQPFTSIGDNCILWSGNHIGHHSVIKNHCFLASHIVVSGAVTIDEYTFIGVNATIRDNIKIGKSNVIGAGSVILSDTEDLSVFSPGASEKLRVPSNRLRSI
jgi:sugar O-acyltransferase (sialic acid O-acetyltransferase NeuD family)